MKERLTTRVFLDLPYDQYAFWLIQGDMIGSHITMETKQPYITYEPLFRIKKSEAQILMDDLWNAGIRPTEGAGSAGSLAATQNHLEDMRMIAFHKMNIPIKGK